MDETKTKRKPRQEAYTPAQRHLLSRLINQYDPNRITWTPMRSAAHTATKRKIWDLIVSRFNQASGRREPSDAAQLIKQGQIMKMNVR